MLIRVAEVVELLGISRATLYNWVAAKKIPHLTIHGRIRFDEAEIRAWLDGQRVPARKENRDASTLHEGRGTMDGGLLDRSPRSGAPEVPQSVPGKHSTRRRGARAGG